MKYLKSSPPFVMISEKLFYIRIIILIVFSSIARIHKTKGGLFSSMFNRSLMW